MRTAVEDRRARLAEVAQRYYVDGWSQDEVATALGTSRSNVSRLLDAARREGVVRFVIDHPLQRHEALESAIRSRFAVGDVRVVGGDDADLDHVGRIGAQCLLDAMTDVRRVAIGWGRSVEAVVRNVAAHAPLDAEVVQVGGALTMAPAASGHELVRRLADALGGRNRFLHAPALVESATVARELRNDPRIAAELDRARRADVAIVGIGLPGVGFAESAIAESYEGDERPAAVVCARLIDADGRELAGPLRDRVIAIDLDDLENIPLVIGVAAGSSKGTAVAAALRSGCIDILVCDQSAAAAALDQFPKEDTQ